MSDSPYKCAHIADLEDRTARPYDLPLSVLIRPAERRAKVRQAPLARVAVNNSTISKNPDLRGRPSGQHSFAELYKGPNQQQALRDNAENDGADKMAHTSSTSKTRVARADSSLSDASRLYFTAGEGESDSSSDNRSFSSAFNVIPSSVEKSRPTTPIHQMITSLSPSAVDKEPLTKPVLRNAYSPEGRGTYDATDATFDVIPSPLLGPYSSQSSLRESNAETLVDLDRHASPAPSMASGSQDMIFATDGILNGYTKGSPVLLGTPAIALTSRNGLRPITNSTEVSGSSNYPASGSGSDGFRRHPSTSHTGSPVTRNRIPNHKTSRSSLRGYDAFSEGLKARVTSNAKAALEKAKGLPNPDTSSMSDSIKATKEDMYRLESDSEDGGFDDGPGHAAISPTQGDDDMRRSEKYDCGPTVRYSIDCREVIMGKAGGQPLTHRNLTDARIAVHDKYKDLKSVNTKSTLRNADGTIERERSYTEVHLHMSDKIVVARAGVNALTCEPKLGLKKSLRELRAKDASRGPSPGVGIFPARTSSLATPDVDKQTATPSFASHLARPTASSAAREAASKAAIATNNTSRLNGKGSNANLRHSTGPTLPGNPKISGHAFRKSLPAAGTISSVKRAGQDLKSKFSSMMASRNRAEKNGPSNANGIIAVDEKTSTTGSRIPSRQPSRNMTTYKNSGMERNTSQIIRPYDKTPIRGGNVNRGEGHAVGTGNPRPTDTTSNRLSLGTLPSSGNLAAAVLPVAGAPVSSTGNARPMTPGSANGLDLGDALGALPGAQASAVGDIADDMTDTMLQAAQADLLEVIRFADHVADPVQRRNILAIIQLLGTAIGRARDLRIATLAQQTANMDLARAVRDFGTQITAAL